MATPAADVDIDPALVRGLLQEQRPDLADLPIRVVANGWDNAIVRVGDELMVRAPRRAAAATLIEHEQRWLPELSSRLPLAAPVPTFAGSPTDRYPWCWSICRWIPGTPATVAPPVDPEAEVVTLAAFIRALHVPAPNDAPANPVRGVPLHSRHDAVTGRLDTLHRAVDRVSTLEVWERLASTSSWIGPPLWLHGDLHPANILTADGALTAVIDWGDITSGDPATDLAVAWMSFDRPHRAAFRAAVGADDDTWHRAAGWALSLALAYLTSDPDSPMQPVGRHTLHEVLGEFG